MRSIMPLLLFSALALASAPSAAQVTATKIHAKVGGSSGSTIADNTRTSVLMAAPDDTQSAQVATSFGGPTVSVSSTAVSMLSNSAVGLSSQWIGESVSGVNLLRFATGGGQIDFNDQIDVTSTLLPDSTPVVVTFSFFAVHSTMLLHTDGTTSFNNSAVKYHWSAQLTNLVSFQNTLVIPNADHRYQTDFGLIGTQTSTGMMNPAISQLDIAFDTFVGETIDLAFRLTANVDGSVASTGVGNVDVNVGSGIGAVGLAFGASPAVGDVVLESQVFSGEFPSQEMASQENAESVLPTAPQPVPALTHSVRFLLLAGMMGGALRCSMTTRSRQRSPAG